MTATIPWWKKAVFYQIYPRSFMDSNSDGIGDLPGITEKMPYLKRLGIDAIWISPFFESPMKDYGYDVSDYCAVDPIFGNMDDFKRLMDSAHKHGIKVMIDQVLSHTSNRHPWFQESRKNDHNAKADWYVWADPQEDGAPPNNWQSIFGGPAWHFDVMRGQYYLHNFLIEQPDLNFHNKDVQDAILESCKFWLDLGVHGFRLDTVNFYVHDQQLRSNPPRSSDPNATSFASQFEKPDPYSMQLHIYDKSRPENLDFIKRLRALSDQYDDIVLLGEIGDDHPYERVAEYTSGDRLLHTAYNTDLMSGERKALTPALIREPLEKEADYGKGTSWPSWAFSNHDVVRVFSRWGQDIYDKDPHFKRMVTALLLSLRGTIFMYQGDELGLTEATLNYEDLQDPWGIYLWPEWQGRDGCRTPMPWNDTRPYGGFMVSEPQGQDAANDPKPWLPLDEPHFALNADDQEQNSDSHFHFTRHCLNTKRENPALQYGDMTFNQAFEDQNILCFERVSEDQKILCLFHMSPESVDVKLDQHISATMLEDNCHVQFEKKTLHFNGFGFCFLKL